jgi:hypothetical protein
LLCREATPGLDEWWGRAGAAWHKGLGTPNTQKAGEWGAGTAPEGLIRQIPLGRNVTVSWEGGR